ncbi:hypothetical protein CPLU01_01867 [Colletotrichum plurivorum]|uniref:Uncharacterized protein n=1 Tax=Colletotrichum plurivorum TaxID=2175906 RepID=A0A8H6NMU7_9PEZI|nr:hypothetical protein CPLU01_01867 [Colletotrichum plurivorum]
MIAGTQSLVVWDSTTLLFERLAMWQEVSRHEECGDGRMSCSSTYLLVPRLFLVLIFTSGTFSTGRRHGAPDEEGVGKAAYSINDKRVSVSRTRGLRYRLFAVQQGMETIHNRSERERSWVFRRHWRYRRYAKVSSTTGGSGSGKDKLHHAARGLVVVVSKDTEEGLKSGRAKLRMPPPTSAWSSWAAPWGVPAPATTNESCGAERERGVAKVRPWRIASPGRVSRVLWGLSGPEVIDTDECCFVSRLRKRRWMDGDILGEEKKRRSEAIVGTLNRSSQQWKICTPHHDDDDVVGSSHAGGRASEVQIYDTPVSWILSHQSCGGVGKGAKGGKTQRGQERKRMKKSGEAGMGPLVEG